MNREKENLESGLRHATISFCRNYEQATVNEALKEALQYYGGLENYVSPGSRVLIKPNLLAPASSADAVTTHPAVVQAVIEAVQSVGGKAYIGDSSMHGSLQQVAEVSGIMKVVQNTGAELLPMEKKKILTWEGAHTCPAFAVSAEAMEMDLIINLAKLKTHTLTGLTAAVKNCYGLIVGNYKRYYHLRHPGVGDFGHMLLDLYLNIKPSLSLVDAVVAMEGLGPRNGRPRNLGALLASPDGLALDAACARLVGYVPGEVSVLEAAVKRGYLKRDLSDVEISGPFQELCLQDFDKGASGRGWSFLWRYMPARLREIRELYRPWPHIGSRCTHCKTCLDHCPVGCIFRQPASSCKEGSKRIKDGRNKHGNNVGQEVIFIDHSSCIRCYCCQEVCPQNAVELKRKKM